MIKFRTLHVHRTFFTFSQLPNRIKKKKKRITERASKFYVGGSEAEDLKKLVGEEDPS